MYRLYDFLPSGNGYKVRLLLNQLKIPFHWIEVDILREETRKPEFLMKNPNGRIPVLEISPNQYLAESNAILYYLSQNTSYFPSDSWHKAQVMQWLFFEQYSHEPYIATSRYWLTILNQPDKYQRELEKKKQGGYHALKIMEAHLQTRSFFVNEQYTIADIALYAYTHVAEEGGFNLQSFPSILSWLNRVEQKPDYISITHRF
jgi:glutathione S-transferase